MTDQTLVTTGLIMPKDFATAPYTAVHSRAGPLIDAQPHAWPLYAGAWNAVSYRFHACADHDEVFTASVERAGGSPPSSERYVQERELFNFFVNGLATMESLCFGLFAIGFMLALPDFPIATPKDLQRITPESTAKAYASAFPGEKITDALGQLTGDQSFIKWKEVRNVLAHRSAPRRAHSRTIAVSIPSGDAPATVNTPSDPPPTWLNGVLIDVNTTSARRAWLADVTHKILEAAATFVAARL